jgi:hypothetical protein
MRKTAKLGYFIGQLTKLQENKYMWYTNEKIANETVQHILRILETIKRERGSLSLQFDRPNILQGVSMNILEVTPEATELSVVLSPIDAKSEMSTEAKLEEALQESFPASDPPALHRDK